VAIQAATCGTGGLGKTSLVKTLLGLPYDAGEITTHGLRITELQVPHPGQQDVLMRLAAWDFGGQEIYHATHQFFLTDQSLFVLVWNARTGNEHGRLRYWLDLITARAPQARSSSSPLTHPPSTKPAEFPTCRPPSCTATTRKFAHSPRLTAPPMTASPN